MVLLVRPVVTAVALTEPGYLGPYRLLDVLGEGGMARVYLAEHGLLGRRVAIKVLRPPFADVPDARERFLREARIAATVRDPHLVQVTDFATDPQHGAYYVMELLTGETLAERIDRNGAMPASVALRLALEVASGVVALHRAGVVHRDLKADNVFLAREGGQQTVKLIDFGVARWLRSARRAPSPTIDGALIGTPEYMAPEQVGGDEVDQRTDVWAFGALLYEMITGERPFAGTRLRELLMSVVADDPPPLACVAPAGLEPLIRACLAKEPADRPASMLDVADELSAIAADYEHCAEALDAAIEAPARAPSPSPMLDRAIERAAPSEPSASAPAPVEDAFYEAYEVAPAIAPADEAARPRRRTAAITAAILLVLIVVGGAVGLGASMWMANHEVEIIAPVSAAGR